ncbi:hypothetical protein BCV69DRAFT_241476, partial [Microstroma glucosiphilum]
DILELLRGMVKLNNANWHTWLLDFKSTFRTIPLVMDIMTGTIKDDHPSYDAQLDAKFVGIIRNSCDKESSKNIRHIVNVKEWNTGSELFQQLQSELCRDDDITSGSLLMELGRVRMFNNDVEKTISEINDIATKGSLIGLVIEDQQKVTQLASCTQFSQGYGEVWSTLETVGKAHKWQSLCAAMRRRHNRIKNDPGRMSSSRRSSAPAAMPSSSDSQGVSQAYLLGKRDPRKPDEPAKCYDCGDPGHIAKNCPN